MSAFTLFSAFLALVFINFIPSCHSLGSTDTITWGGSNDRTGYEENHNMDPAVVSSPQFGFLFRTPLPGKNMNGGPEQVFASPLVYTASDGVQYVYVATTMNNVYKINAKTGSIVASRNLAVPFLQTDLQTCTDISPTIGSTATGVIDPATGTWYMTVKTYADQSVNGATGRPNGRYQFHAISTDDLSERPSFPINPEYTVARNNPLRSFTAGIHHQRPGLLQFNNYIYLGFASHCIQYNYTGWIMGFHKDTANIVEAYAMEAAGVGPQTSGAGVWMSGGGLASNGVDSIYWSTGNGNAGQLDQSPVSGRQPPTSLEEAAVHAAVNADGTITPVDFFMPWEKVQLDGADKDLGTSPLQLLPSQFSCGSVQRIGMVTGKSGKTYWLNMDDMGGFRNGANRLDNVLQTYQHENSVYAGAAVYPLEGGYVYINVINYPTRVFQFTCQGGTPYFNPVATTSETNAGRLSVGHGTVTSLGQDGTGLLWVSDMDGSNLRIYDPVPYNGKMTLLNSFATPGVTKFSKLSFGDGIVYQITSSGYLYAYGSPVNLPLNCSVQDFPATNLNSTSPPQTISCQAKVDLTVVGGSSPQNFGVTLPTLPLQVTAGSNFTFQASFSPTVVGSLSSSLFLNTTQGAAGYTSTTQVQLRGTATSTKPVLAINPLTVTWNGVLTGDSVNQTVIFMNRGNSTLNITSIKYSQTSEQGPWIATNGSSAATVVGPFTFFNMPSTIPALSSVTVPINFNPVAAGGYAVYIRVDSNGGSSIFDVFATGAEVSQALLEFETLNGTWTKYDNSTPFDFGDVQAGTTRYLRLRLSNVGGPNAAPISVTVSKPPFGIPGILGASNGVDLGEGQLINSGSNKTAQMFCAPPKSQLNQPSYNGSTTWTMNLNDPTFGHQLIHFTCNTVTQQVGPTNNNGSVLYQYAGCYQEYNPGRQLQTQIYTGPNNTDTSCINQCSNAGYIFAGTQFKSECWCGNNRPLTNVADGNCYYECSGDPTQVCGGNGINRGGTYISLFGDISRWDGNTTNTPGPYVNPGANGFTSIGCYSDSTAQRTLSVPMNDNNTVASCLQACQGYTYAGLEFGNECYCGNTLLPTSIQTPIGDCSSTCQNNYTEFCGGASRLNVYQFGLNTSTATSSAVSSTTSAVVLPSLLPNVTSSIGLNTTTATDNSTTSTTANTLMATANVTSSTTLATPIGLLPTPNVLTSTTSSGASSSSTTNTSSTTSASTTASNVTATTTLSYNTTSTAMSSDTSTLSSFTSSSTTDFSNATSTVMADNSTSTFSSSLSTTSSSFVANITTTTAMDNTTSTATTALSVTSSVPVNSSTTVTITSTLTTTSSLTTSSSMSLLTSTTTLAANSSSTASIATSTSSLLLNSTSTASVSTSASTSPLNSTSTLSTTTAAPSNSSSTLAMITSATSMPLNSTSAVATTTSAVTLTPAVVSNSSSTTTSSASLSSSSSILAANSSTIVPTTSSSPLSTTATAMNSTTVASSITSVSSTILNSTTQAVPTTLSTTASTTTSATGKPTPTIVRSSGLYTYANCYKEATNIRALSSTFTYSPNMTIGMCASFCSAQSYSYMATEYGSECYCGNKINAAQGAVVATDGRCKLPCAGDGSQICGGSYGLSLYTLGLPYVGCAVDTAGAGGARTLSGPQFTAPDMTIGKCLSACGTDYALAGVEYGSECYCGSPSTPLTLVDPSACNTKCKGASDQNCGGTWRLSVYNNTAYIPPVVKPTIQGYAYKGCYQDSAQRVFKDYISASNTMTQDLCVGICKGKGLAVAGLEWNRECWCAKSMPVGIVTADEGDCSYKCAGDTTQLCGGSYRLGVWGL